MNPVKTYQESTSYDNLYRVFYQKISQKMGCFVWVTKTAWNVLSGVTEMAWDVLSGATKTAWGALSWDIFVGCFVRGVKKMAWDVLSWDILSGSHE